MRDSSTTEQSDCPCSRHLDAEFECRAPEQDCPRLRWLEAFEQRASAHPDAGDRRAEARAEIDRMATALGLPADVAETAVELFDHARADDLLVGRSVESLAAAALYAAARQSQVPRTLDEVAAVSRAAPADVGRVHRAVAAELDLPVEPATPTDHLPRYADRLDLPPATELVAERLLDTAERRGIASGREPASLVAAAIYAAGLLTDRDVDQQEIAEATDVAVPTIGRLYRTLLEAVDVLSGEE